MYVVRIIEKEWIKRYIRLHISVILFSRDRHLMRQISDINNIIFRILDLQKDRYFETLAAKYWNQTLKAQCPNSDENEGITLESLGSSLCLIHY